MVELAYQASYGFEWSRDSLLLARENLLYTYRDYYFAKWNEEPPYDLFEKIAVIISYNVFQMDGLTYTVPLTEKRIKVAEKYSLFDTDEPAEEKWETIPGTKVKIMKFDVVVGNPPYQEEAVGTSTKDLPIYPHFYSLAEQCASKYVLISPARFLFNAGGTKENWNEKMLDDPHIKVEQYWQKSAEVFPDTDIKGGVVIVHRDADKVFGKIGTFAHFPELNSLIIKVAKLNEKTLDDIVSNRGQYRFSDKIYQDYPEEMKRISDRRISTNAFDNLPNLFATEKPNDRDEYIRIFGRIDNNRAYKWFNRKYLSEPITFNKYKVILPKGNGSGAIGEVLSTPLVGEPLVGEPLVGFTETFISIGAFDNETEAQNCLKYVKSKFARTMLGVLKVTQDNPREKWAKVPLQDFTPQSDIDWTKSVAEIDGQLYAKYGLDESEIAFIEEKVAAME